MEKLFSIWFDPGSWVFDLGWAVEQSYNVELSYITSRIMEIRYQYTAYV